MKAKKGIHHSIYGEEIPLAGLDDGEKKLVKRIQAKFSKGVDWNEFDNFWEPLVMSFYAARGLSRTEMRRMVPYRIAQDLSSRMAISAGYARMPDYRDELIHLILTRFRTRREFCKVTGLTEDMLSHVLANRKHFAIDTLETALERIGYRLRIVPVETLEGRQPPRLRSKSGAIPA